jgi:hypothetical protein
VLNALASAIVFAAIFGVIVHRLLRLWPGGDVGFDNTGTDRTGAKRPYYTSADAPVSPNFAVTLEERGCCGELLGDAPPIWRMKLTFRTVKITSGRP